MRRLHVGALVPQAPRGALAGGLRQQGVAHTEAFPRLTNPFRSSWMQHTMQAEHLEHALMHVMC